ncbi:MAG: UvrD-helicase domain-containing protein, partial [Pseudomonadota bacterium]
MAARIADHLGAWTDRAEAELNETLAALLGHAPDKAETMRARTLFARVLDAPGGMPIQTIHAFCQSLLRRFPLEAGIAPHFSVMDERDSEEMLSQAREDVLTRARIEATGVDGSLRAALAAVTRHVNEENFAELMAALASDRARLARIFAHFGSVAAVVQAVRGVLGLKAGETPETILAAACADGAFDGAALKRAGRALAETDNSDAQRGQAIAAWLGRSPIDRAATFDDYRDVFLTFAKEPPAPRKRMATKEARKNDPAALEVLTSEAERLLGVVFRRRAAETAAATAGLLTLAGALDETYARAKRARALLDYDDLIHAARRLLAVQGDASWVLYKLDGGIDHILIDEAQDTNPEQWRVVEKLAAEFFAGAGAHEAQAKAPRTVFAVGDVKQSIYGFQGADPNAFLDMRALFAKKAEAARRAWRTVDLNVSFRSVQTVLDAVDATFARPEAADGVALDGGAIRHQAFRAGQAGLVELW